ncbi:YdbH domain-containing protein, partial [Sphingomonas bacterium]|uniref:YdbH domain-containing protein n=1 Tax=Sphingomonas bacterium TaxID=1895847 RepID=UPI0015761F35
TCSAAASQTGPRFCPILARDVALRLAGDRIAATGTLVEPITATRVAALTVAHDLGTGTGHADLAIDKLSFAKAFQPNLLTPVVTGTVADVAGTIDGEGHIGWSDAGLTSTGRFTTAGTDLAAAFGPVTGIAGSITFTDLLALVSAPGQEVSVASINPGIPVEHGAIRFHTEAGPRIAVESARWPFAGGTLTLDPTLLDFAAPAERHMTFRLDGVAADRFLQQFDFKNLAATGTFDGVLPMIFDARGGRIEGGRLTVREGGGGIAYVGDLAQKNLGFWGNLAFQALKSLRYRSLAIAMNGPLEGEMITDVRFAGVSQGQGARSNFLIRRLQRLPFVFNVRIKAPFRELVQTTSSFSDPTDLLRRSLPALIGPSTVQPAASAPVPSARP